MSSSFESIKLTFSMLLVKELNECLNYLNYGVFEVSHFFTANVDVVYCELTDGTQLKIAYKARPDNNVFMIAIFVDALSDDNLVLDMVMSPTLVTAYQNYIELFIASCGGLRAGESGVTSDPLTMNDVSLSVF